MRFPNIAWAMAERGIPQYKLASMVGRSEARLSRCLAGRSEFTPEECAGIAEALNYPAEWLFREPRPPSRLSDVSTESVKPEQEEGISR